MLQSISPEAARRRVFTLFSGLRMPAAEVPLDQAAGRVLYADVPAPEDVPGFTRSAVDGYAVRSADTFGCSDALPALLACAGEVEMGREAEMTLEAGKCVYVPTGGALPAGSDAMVMIESTEDYGGVIGVYKPTAPGTHCIFQGDDVRAGQVVLRAGKKLLSHDIGALAAIGAVKVLVCARPVVGILSSGDELTSIERVPAAGQVRDVNSHLLYAAVTAAGGEARRYGVCPDEPERLREIVGRMAEDCDVLLLSGGTSAGRKDAMPEVVKALGTLHLHGIAMKPGKPAIVGEIRQKPVFGLPGHPVAAYYVFRTFVEPLLHCMMNQTPGIPLTRRARLDAAVPSNHGREEFVAVRLSQTAEGLVATPIRGKSGLITLLAGADGYLRIPRDQEGVGQGAIVDITPF